MNDNIPLYNSRITNTYLEYISEHHPDIDIDSILDFAEMKRYEVEDPSHWFTQRQVDRFHHILVEKTNDPNISRDAGRFTVLSKKIGAVKQYTLGLMSPASVYMMTGKLYGLLSRGASIKTKTIDANCVQVIVTPKPGVNEKPFQCENRIGTLESLAKLFTGDFAKVSHSRCFHKGDSSCAYVISWPLTKSMLWERIRNYSFLGMLFVLVFLFMGVPLNIWFVSVLLFIIAVLVILCVSLCYKKKEFSETLSSQGNTAIELLDAMNERYNNALLMQEISHATATILDRDQYLDTVMQIMEKFLSFDRGLMMLEQDGVKGTIQYAGGFGLTSEQQRAAEDTPFRLDVPDSKGIFTEAYRKQESFLVEDIREIMPAISERGKSFAEKIASTSFICVPVVYANESLGILAVDNQLSEQPLTKSDLNVLSAIASQMAIGIANVRTYKELQERKEELKELFETSKKAEELYSSLLFSSPDAIAVFDLEGRVKYLNPEFERTFGWSMKEAKGKKFDLNDQQQNVLAQLSHMMNTKKPYFDFETKWYAKNGHLLEVNISASHFADHEGKTAGMLFVIRDVSEKKKLESQLLQSKKMEALGILVSGVAHEINNPINGIINYAQILVDMETDEKEAEIPLRIIKEGERIVEIVKNLLSVARTTKGHRIVTNIRKPILEAVLLITPQLKKDNIRANMEIPENLPKVMVNGPEIMQVFLNILSNAQYAVNEKGVSSGIRKIISVEAQKTTIDGLEFVRTIFFDNGIGMGRTTLEKVFNPFFSTKPTGQGTGLGLSISHSIVKDHGGKLAFESFEGEFTKVFVDLPTCGADR